MKFQLGYMLECIPKIIRAFPVTLYMTMIPMLIGLGLGLVMEVVITSRSAFLGWLRILVRGFLVVIRGIPIILHLLIFYFIFPRIFPFMNGWNKVSYVILVFSIVIGVQASEIFRSAYGAVDRGQYEAAYSIGYTAWQTWFHITSQQAFRIAFPNLANLLITMMKDTSLAFALGIVDMIGYAKILDANSYGIRRTEIYLAVALIYWFLTIALERGLGLVEKRLSVGISSAAGAAEGGKTVPEATIS